VAALCLAAVALAGCSGGGGSAQKAATAPADRNGDGKVVIGYSSIAYSIAVLPQYIFAGLEADCKTRGWELQHLSAEGDAMLQGEQISQLIQQDLDYLVVFPADPMLAVDWMKEVSEAGIPAVMIHTDVAEVGREYAKAYCGPDNYAMAESLAKAVVEKYGADAGIGIVEIGGVPVQSDYIERVAGFDDYIKANSNFKVLGLEWAYSNRADAQSYMENFISTYGNQINVLMGFDDDLTLGGVNALQAAGMTDVGVYSITGQKEAIQAIKDGKMTMTAYYSTAATAQNALKCIDDLAAGKTIEYFHYTDVPLITKENADKYEGEF
jgi:ABC-type sugar transport system substrate-binding protein